MRVLVIGSGGREHAICQALSRSSFLSHLYCAPGNGGIKQVAECVEINSDDIPGIVEFSKSNEIDLVVVGPEIPLTLGLVDCLNEIGIKAFGPTASAAMLEGSKSFMKKLCDDFDIPTAPYGTFTDAIKAKNFIYQMKLPLVVKADGLAAGKGVIIAESIVEAEKAIDSMLRRNEFGEAGSKIIIEEFLKGEEVSFFALVDGDTILPLLSAQDHKKAYDGDNGPNTGGMGAYSPAPIVTNELQERIMEEIIVPTVQAMEETGNEYKGVLYAGLMITEDGPKLLEYNVRFGDPECQVLLSLLETDLLGLLLACANGSLAVMNLTWKEQVALTVVMANEGYPGKYEKGSEIKGIDKAEKNGATVFHAGTHLKDGRFIAVGGRVLNITATGDNILEAQKKAYTAIEKIDWPEGFYRTDIGVKAT